MAVYSSVSVYEMMVHGIGVMRRRSDSYMNATQILKVAGLEKSKRSRILERDLIQGDHEKVQGGYGRYQGTWIPFNRALELAKQYGVDQILSPIFDYLPGPGDQNLTDNNQVIDESSKAQGPNSNGSNEELQPDLISPPNQSNPKRNRLSTSNHTNVEEQQIETGPSKRSRLNTPSHHSATTETIPNQLLDPSFTTNSLLHPNQNPNSLQTPSSDSESIKLPLSRPSNLPILRDSMDPKQEKHVQTLISIFASPSGAGTTPEELVQLLEDINLEIDLPIDNQSHTALHWASALGRTELAFELVKAGADVMRGNLYGETGLMRATMLKGCYEESCFDELLEILHTSICNTDLKKRNVLHHICLSSKNKGQEGCSRYYLECLFEWIVKRYEGRFDYKFINAKDIFGDTPLNIAARIGDQHLIQMLIDVGASINIPNKLGLKPIDFGVESGLTSLPTIAVMEDRTSSLITEVPVPGPSEPRRSSELIGSMTNLLNSLGGEFETEMLSRTNALERVRVELKTSSQALRDQRKKLKDAKQELEGASLIDLKLKKLRKKIEEEDEFDWTGRSEVNGQANQTEDKAFEYNGIGSTLISLSSNQIGLKLEPDPLLPNINNFENLIYLRRMENWYKRVLKLLKERINLMKGCNLEQESKYLKIISTFINPKQQIGLEKLKGLHEHHHHHHHHQKIESSTSRSKQLNDEEEEEKEKEIELRKKDEKIGMKIEINEIDLELLNQLMIAIESDGPDLDLHRVAGFMNRVNAGLV
ncbi:hypothetical protein CROQUDRAFT_60931 [Cronartium quercuum f. sp. fusiforme G11]|uniref:HTH APSES-type domain-containing protein n=1 Tax=Cronartium quercuum f. sp. fusiforme G11 TaxID=708437 RepID=A0A9P6NRA3_9BASI|nr:hypothetical protein CROQUDRAFT_60931 [Cronartium quercuum f. sp. fusiforme G11]